ncbi:hypothetical protein AAIB33_18455 [Microbacterium sp. AZCO]|uniref:hypothetical protein n=1 Tax=Microbacterium sp. AZCO TaxID=3142976 RepID=UPI0031F3B34E
MSDTHDTLHTGGSTYPTTTSPTGSTPNTGTPSAGDVVDTAKQEAAGVVDTAKSEAKEVGREARTQLSSLYHQTRYELSDQASQRQQKLADGLRSAGSELRGMADSSTDNGVASDVVRQVSQRLEGAASWLGSRGPEGVIDEVKRYARRRPVVFLAAAALAGVVVGRLTRSLAAGQPDDGGASRYTGDGSYPTTGYRTGATYGTEPSYGTGAAYGSAGTYGTGAASGATTDEVGTPIYDATTGVADESRDPLYRSGEDG